MLKGLGQLGDMAKIMKQAKEMQGRMAEMQDKLAEIEVTGKAGGGLVTVTATAKGELTGVRLDPSLMTADNREVAEDLILAAVRDAQGKAAEAAQRQMADLATGMGLPPGMTLPF